MTSCTQDKIGYILLKVLNFIFCRSWISTPYLFFNKMLIIFLAKYK